MLVAPNMSPSRRWTQNHRVGIQVRPNTKAFPWRFVEKTPARGLPAWARVPTLEPVSQRAGTRGMATAGAPAPAARGDDSPGPSLGHPVPVPPWAELLTLEQRVPDTFSLKKSA